MKRMHIHVGVTDLERSTRFYSALFGMEPVKVEADYAKWMLEDPRINFAISTRTAKKGVDHLGLQVDEDAELVALRGRLRTTDLSLFDEGETVCCYARSDKSWLEDPDGIAWEAYRTMADAQIFSSNDSPNAACCASAAETQSGAGAHPGKQAGCCA